MTMSFALLVATSALIPPAVLGQGIYFPPHLQRIDFSVVSEAPHRQLETTEMEVTSRQVGSHTCPVFLSADAIQLGH